MPKKMLDGIDIGEFKKILSRNGVDLDVQTIENFKNELLSNLAILKAAVLDSNVEEINNKYKQTNANVSMAASKKVFEELKIGKVYLLNNNKAIACHPLIEKCFTFYATPKELRDIYKGSLVKDSYSYKYSTPDLYSNESNLMAGYKTGLNQFNEKILPDFRMRIYGDPKVDVNIANKTINLELYENRDKVVIYDGKVDGWRIFGKSQIKSKSELLDPRYDEHLLTSSLTIQDATVNDLDLDFSGGMLEDSINFVRTNGNISSIKIVNSFQDALDIDFSNLIIDSIAIENSGNDCIDLSSGNYTLVDSTLIGCADKGISVGEKSKAMFNSVLVRNANVAFVSKDSSELIIDEGDVSNSLLCAAVYRKKQEFAGAKIKIPIDVCDNKDIFIQTNSHISFQ